MVDDLHSDHESVPERLEGNMDMCRIGIDTYVRKKDSTMELESLKSSSE